MKYECIFIIKLYNVVIGMNRELKIKSKECFQKTGEKVKILSFLTISM